EPAWGSGDWTGLELMLGRILLAALAWGAITAACLGLAAWRLRPAYLRQLQAEGQKKKTRWWQAKRSAIPADPIRWKERQVEGIAPLPVLRQIPGWFGIVTILVLTIISSGTILYISLPSGKGPIYIKERILEGDFKEVANVLDNMTPCDDWFKLQGLL